MALAITTSPVQRVSKPEVAGAHEYGTATVHYNGMYYRFYCSVGINSEPLILNDPLLKGKAYAPDKETLEKSWDYVRMRTSRDGSVWSAPRVVLVPTKNHEKPCACDPAIVYDEKEKYWYLYYTGYIPGSETVTYVARSRNVDGPYIERYVGEGKGNNGWDKNGYSYEPKPILRASSNGGYGLGQISVVRMDDGKYHFWFNSSTSVEGKWQFSHIELNSPYKGLQKKYEELKKENKNKISFTKKPGNEKSFSEFLKNDFGDVKWNPSTGQFEMWITSNHLPRRPKLRPPRLLPRRLLKSRLRLPLRKRLLWNLLPIARLQRLFPLPVLSTTGLSMLTCSRKTRRRVFGSQRFPLFRATMNISLSVMARTGTLATTRSSTYNLGARISCVASF